MTRATATNNKWRRRSRQEWETVFARFAASGLGIEPFCAREGLSESSFRRWRSLLGEPSTQPAGNRSLSGVLCPPAPTRNNPSHIHQGGAGSDQGDSDQQQVAAA